jgi:hypothetical protein
VSQFKYLGTTVTNQNLIQEEIKKRLNSGNACYQSVQNLLSSRLLSKNVKVRIYKTIILPVVLYGCETWSLTLREEYRLRVFENRVLRRIFGSKRVRVTGGWRKLHNDRLHNLYSSPSIIRIIKSRRMRWAGHVARVWRTEMHIRFLWRSQKQMVRCRWLHEVAALWTGLNWLRIGPVEDSCEHGDEPSGPMNSREIL